MDFASFIESGLEFHFKRGELLQSSNFPAFGFYEVCNHKLVSDLLNEPQLCSSYLASTQLKVELLLKHMLPFMSNVSSEPEAAKHKVLHDHVCNTIIL